MTVFVIAGGLSYEWEVLLCSGKHLAGALRKRGHVVTETDVNTNLISRLLGDESPVTVPILHGELGEDGALREAPQMSGMPFVGSDGAGSQRTFDKSVATRLIEVAGLVTPQQVAPLDDAFQELDTQAMMSALGERTGSPLVVKPVRSGSALGTAKVDPAGDLPVAFVGAFAYGKDVAAEEFVEGTELSVIILEDGTDPRVLSPAEIRPASGIYDYESRYTVRATRFLTPGEPPDNVLEAAGDLAARAHRVFGHRDISHIDVIVREDVPAFLENNVAPGLADTSLTPLVLGVADLSMEEMFPALAE